MHSEDECIMTDRMENVEQGVQQANEKLDKVTDLLVSYAHVDEKLKYINKAVNDHEERLRIVEKYHASKKWLSENKERLFWILVTGVVSGFVWYIRTEIG